MVNLEDNKKFCAAPWLHLHIVPNGNAQPCCYWDDEYRRDEVHGNLIDEDAFGNINDYDTVEDLMNNKEFKKLRTLFLNGKTHPGCKTCDRHDEAGRDQSGRKIINNQFLDNKRVQESIENTLDDGTTTPHITYIDIRFGNICNLKCRMCGHGFSSSWYDDMVKDRELRGVIPLQAGIKKFINVDCWDKIEPIVEHAEEIYFAGGEPLLYPEHLKILDKLVETNNTNCRLRYNTNLTSLTYKKRDIVDTWKNFSNVYIVPSIDGTGDTVEYMRTNLDWKVFETNFNRIKEELPDTMIHPGITVGVLNIEKLPEFSKYCIENQWTYNFDLYPNFINYPHNQDIRMLPDWYKDDIVSLFEEHIEWIESRTSMGELLSGVRHINGLRQIVDFMREEEYDNEKKDELVKKLFDDLEKWKIISPEQDWVVKLPHLKQFFDKYELYS